MSAALEAIDESFFDGPRLDELYYYAISCALSVLVRHAELRGRGWYHFADGELIVAAQLLS